MADGTSTPEPDSAVSKPKMRRGSTLSPLSPTSASPIAWVGRAIGGRVFAILDHIGYVLILLINATRWLIKGCFGKGTRLGRTAVVTQIVRVGVRSIVIVCLVSGCVGLILALQLAPPLDEYGSREAVANIIGVAILRELGPLIGSIVLTGFAGASIAAEIGTMAVSEEIDALEAHALNPVRFLVVPRVLATSISMAMLAILADVVAIGAAMAVSVLALDIPRVTYIENTLQQAKFVDFATGVAKAGIFGLLVGTIACANGLKLVGTSSGADGVGRSTTATVVQCIVAITIADLIFTAIFFALKLT
jgi:phospholipid/cholesterol/gamma-HCH transport system permease protein